MVNREWLGVYLILFIVWFENLGFDGPWISAISAKKSGPVEKHDNNGGAGKWCVDHLLRKHSIANYKGVVKNFIVASYYLLLLKEELFLN